MHQREPENAVIKGHRIDGWIHCLCTMLSWHLLRSRHARPQFWLAVDRLHTLRNSSSYSLCVYSIVHRCFFVSVLAPHQKKNEKSSRKTRKVEARNDRSITLSPHSAATSSILFVLSITSTQRNARAREASNTEEKIWRYRSDYSASNAYTTEEYRYWSTYTKR